MILEGWDLATPLREIEERLGIAERTLMVELKLTWDYSGGRIVIRTPKVMTVEEILPALEGRKVHLEISDRLAVRQLGQMMIDRSNPFAKSQIWGVFCDSIYLLGLAVGTEKGFYAPARKLTPLLVIDSRFREIVTKLGPRVTAIWWDARPLATKARRRVVSALPGKKIIAYSVPSSRTHVMESRSELKVDLKFFRNANLMGRVIPFGHEAALAEWLEATRGK